MSLVDAALVRCTRTAHQRADEERSDLPTLVLPRRGVFRHHAGQRTTVADANTVLLFHPDEPYRITHPTDHGDECVALRFDRDVVADALGRAGEHGAAWILGAATHRALHRAAHAVLAAHETLEREERALALLATVGAAQPVASEARDAARIDAVRERLAADAGAHASLAALARDAGVSAFHLARRFRARTGTSLHQYRLALRLATARTMILGGENNLTRLAHDLGFASLAHFSAAFRNAYGHSPSTVVSRKGQFHNKSSACGHFPISPVGVPVRATIWNKSRSMQGLRAPPIPAAMGAQSCPPVTGHCDSPLCVVAWQSAGQRTQSQL